ncbi:MAG TPA: J domain-containing protein [Desulfurivibrionaceae bacterium]|nr:J domain-containing protein [Desulfurivibrionaceae bacterium]
MRKKIGKGERLRAARELLGLDSYASLEEIKLAYRRKAKAHHPDLSEARAEAEERIEMHRLTEAYRVLTDYCFNYRIPLEPTEEPLDDEEWWLRRFGNDPLWGKGKG